MSDVSEAVQTAGSLWAVDELAAERIIVALETGRSAKILSATAEGKAILEKAFNPSAHPRAAAGTAAGGQFVAASGSSQQKETASKGAEKLLGRKLSVSTIKAFQKSHGIQVDGRIGRQTAAALLGSKNAKKLKPGTMSSKQRAALEKYAMATTMPTLVHTRGRKDFRPSELRDRHGRWTSGGRGANPSTSLRYVPNPPVDPARAVSRRKKIAAAQPDVDDAKAKLSEAIAALEKLRPHIQGHGDELTLEQHLYDLRETAGALEPGSPFTFISDARPGGGTALSAPPTQTPPKVGKAFNPSERRDPHGEWTSGGAIAHGLGEAIRALKPGETTGSKGSYVKRLKTPDLAGNRYEVGVQGLAARRHKTAQDAYEDAVRMGIRLEPQPART